VRQDHPDRRENPVPKVRPDRRENPEKTALQVQLDLLVLLEELDLQVKAPTTFSRATTSRAHVKRM
jgi:hypothetical protein